MQVETLAGLAEEVLADELLADELSAEAAKSLRTRLKKLPIPARKKFLQRLSPMNQAKLVKSLKRSAAGGKLKRLLPGKMAVSGLGNDPYAYGDTDVTWTPGAFQDTPGMYINQEALADEYLGKPKAKRLEKKAKKAEAKAAKAKPGSTKQKRLQTRAKIKKAKAAGDKTALKSAKKERRKRIGNTLKKVGKTVAKLNPAFAVGRGAFLGMVRLNTRALATNMKKMFDSNEAGQLVKRWEAMGGSGAKLKDAAMKGAKKKPLLGSRKAVADEMEEIWGLAGIEAAPAVGAVAAAAAPILVALVPIIKLFMKKKGIDESEIDEAEDDAEEDIQDGKAKKLLNKVSGFFKKVGGKITNAGEAIENIEEKLQEKIDPDYKENEDGEPEEEKKAGGALALVGTAVAAFLALKGK